MLGISDSLAFFSSKYSTRARQYLASGLILTLGAALLFMVVGYLTIAFVLADQPPGFVYRPMVPTRHSIVLNRELATPIVARKK
jgi:hypothetical protein